MNTVTHRFLNCRGILWVVLFCAIPGCSFKGPDASSSDERAVAAMATLKTHQEVLALATTIADPIFRASAVQKWVEAHRAALVPDDARVLCDTLSPESADHCWHIYSAAHLR